MDKLQRALDRAGFRKYRDESCTPLTNAQRNLDGRTHYVDDDTLRYFNARLNSAYRQDDGLTFYIRESVHHPSDGRLYRCVLFDIFGNVVSPREAYKTDKAALKAYDAWRVAFDPIAHTLNELERRMTRQRNEANDVLTILDGE